jgi:hypothetical protein
VGIGVSVAFISHFPFLEIKTGMLLVPSSRAPPTELSPAVALRRPARHPLCDKRRVFERQKRL